MKRIFGVAIGLIIMLLSLTLPLQAGDFGLAEEVYVRSFDSTYVSAYLRVPSGDGPHPAIIFIHGGVGGFGMQLTKKAAHTYVQSHFFSDGYAVFQLDYRRFDFGDVELEDIVAGFRYLQSRPEIDPGRIGVIGGSHGGYLALMLATRVRPTATVVFAGLTDLTSLMYERTAEFANQPNKDPLWRERSRHEGRSLLEETEMIEEGQPAPHVRHARGEQEVQVDLAERWGDDIAIFKQYSPIEQVDQIKGPILYLVGSEDRQKQGGKLLVEKLNTAGQTAEYSEHPGMPHGFYWGIRPDSEGNLPTEFYLALKKTTDFMRKWLKIEK